MSTGHAYVAIKILVVAKTVSQEPNLLLDRMRVYVQILLIHTYILH